VRRADKPCHLHVPIVLKSWSLNLLEPSGPVKDCNGIALPLRFTFIVEFVSQAHPEFVFGGGGEGGGGKGRPRGYIQFMFAFKNCH
jgi:hypothetical protein